MKKFWKWAAGFWDRNIRLRIKFGGIDRPDFAYDVTNDIQKWLNKRANK